MDQVTNKNFIKALRYFPKWMQIRRRPYKSTSGHLLYSIIEEMTSIYKEVDEFAKDFFLVNYAGREHTIISEVYVANIGSLHDSLILDNGLSIVTDLNKFYKKSNVAYYEDGNFYFKINEINNQDLGYSINNFHYTVPLRKEPVWNIFDEFAWFAGIDRIPGESNLSLSNRTYDALRTKNNKNNNILFDDPDILSTYKHRFNSTEFGLKYLIKNILSAFAGIAFRDINIEQLNNINIQDVVKDEKVYDLISRLNKDIAREKVWDLTLWENEFKKTDYLPHIWDQPIEYYLDGVGYYDSLKVTTSELIDSSDVTNVDIIGYKKSAQKINEYLVNSNKNVNIDVDLKKYTLDLKPTDIQYSLKASSAVEVPHKSISFNLYKTYNGEYKLPLEDFVNYDILPNSIAVNNKGLLVNNTNQEQRYKIVAYPKYQSGNIYIESFKEDNIEKLSSIYNDQYFKNEQGSISYQDNYFYGSDISDFASSNFIYNTKDGMKLDINKSNVATLQIPLTANMEYRTINYSIVDTATNITNRFDLLQLNNFKHNVTNNYLFINTNESGSIQINQIINSLEFEIDKLSNENNTGSCRIEIRNDKNQLIHTEELNTYSTNKVFRYYSSDGTIKHISIIKIGQIGFKIKYIKATSNNIVFSIDGKQVSKSLGTFTLPNNIDNKVLTVSLYSYLGISSPAIEYISIAGEYSSFKYWEKEVTVPANSQKQIKIISRDTKLSLFKDNQLIDDNFDTYDSFNGSGRLPLDIPQANILKSDYEILTGQINKHNTEYINISSDVKYIILTFKDYEQEIISRTLLDIVKTKYNFNESNEFIYATYGGKLVLYSLNKNDVFTEIEISADDLNSYYNKIKVIKPEALSVIFSHNKSKSIKSRSDVTYNKIDSIMFEPAKQTNHLFYKSDTIIQNQKEYQIDINDFLPKLESNKVYLFETNLPDNYNKSSQYIRYNHKTKEVLSRWCLYGNKINIATPSITVFINLWNENEANYNIGINKVFKTTLFSSELSLQDSYRIDNKDYILSEYILKVPNYLQVVYINKEYTETIDLTEDGLGKFKKSNVLTDNIKLSISGQALTKDDYELYQEPGIIQVKTIPNFNSLALSATYTYKHPSKIVFTNLDTLYSIIEHNIDAYDTEKIDTIYGMKDGDSKQIVLKSNSNIDKLVANSSNINFVAVVIDNKVTVYRNNLENKIAVKSGYYYEAGKEYYYPADEKELSIKRDKYVDLENTKKQGSLLKLLSKRQNFIPNSLMANKTLNPLCYINFKEQKEVSEVSSLRSLTTENTFNNWLFKDTVPSLIKQNTSYAIKFTFEASGYGAFRIDPYLYKDSYCYIKKSGDIKISLYKENKIIGFRLQKRPLLEYVTDFIDSADFAFLNFKPEEDYQYYLIVTGTAGVIEEIVLSDILMQDVHVKNIDKYGWDINEKSVDIPSHIIFDTFNYYTSGNIDVDDNNTVQYGTTIDYDATLIGTSDFKRCQLDKVLLRDNKLITLNEPGTVTTEIFDLIHKMYPDHYLHNVLYMIAKLNLVQNNQYKIRILGSDNYYTPFSFIDEITNGSFVALSNENLKRYIRFEIEIPANSELNSLEVYNVYDELEDQAIESYEVEMGDLVSRIFNVPVKQSYVISSIDADIHGDVIIKARSLRTRGTEQHFTDWKEIYRNGKIKEQRFDNTDSFQFKIELLSKESTINLQRIGLTNL